MIERDKFALVLRIETTTNDVAAFKHHRRVDMELVDRTGGSPPTLPTRSG
jgi:hypothetical protein